MFLLRALMFCYYIHFALTDHRHGQLLHVDYNFQIRIGFALYQND